MNAIRSTSAGYALLGIERRLLAALGITHLERWRPDGGQERVARLLDEAYRLGRRHATHDPTPQEAEVHMTKLHEAMTRE